MATLTAIADVVTATVQVTGVFADHPDQTPITVYRVLPDGTRTPIRGGNPVLTSGTTFVLYDTEAPLNVAVWYEATASMDFIANDLFTRSVGAGSWGNATSGQTWTAAAAQLSVNGSSGVITHDVAPQSIFNTLNLTTDLANLHLRGTLRRPAVSVGASLEQAWLARYDGTSYYAAGLVWDVSGVVRFTLFKNIVGVVTTLELVTLPQTYTGAELFWIAVEADDTTLRAKVWPTTMGEPTQWTFTHTNATELVSGDVGVRGRRNAGNTNVNPTLFFDNLFVYDLDAEEVATSATVTIGAQPDGWVKSPLYPLDDLRLDNCDVHSPACLETDQNVFFQRLEAATYRSATGVFDIVGDPRPRTVAMPRKAKAVGLVFVSRKLSSIAEIEALFAPGTNLMLQLPAKYGWATSRYSSDYVTVGDVESSPVGVDMSKPYRVWTVPLSVANPPADTVSGGSGGSPLGPRSATYGEMAADGYTYAQLAAFGNTYTQWAQGDWD